MQERNTRGEKEGGYLAMGMRYRAPFGVMHNSVLTCMRAVCSQSGYFAGNGMDSPSARPSVRQPLKGSRNFLRSHGNGRKGGPRTFPLVTLSCPHSPLTHFLTRSRSHSCKYGRWRTRESMSEHASAGFHSWTEARPPTGDFEVEPWKEGTGRHFPPQCRLIRNR